MTDVPPATARPMVTEAVEPPADTVTVAPASNGPVSVTTGWAGAEPAFLTVAEFLESVAPAP